MDLSTIDKEDGKPWNLSCPKKAEKAMKMLKESRPQLLIGSPIGAIMSNRQNINPERVTSEQNREIQQDKDAHVHALTEMYKEQAKHGVYYIHEHPESETSWNQEDMLNMLNQTETKRTKGHMTRQSSIKASEDKKHEVGWMTNSSKIANAMKKRHWKLDSTKPEPETRADQEYPKKMCKEIIRGLMEQIICDRIEAGIQWIEGSTAGTKYYDDVTGEQLDTKGAETARKTEMEEVSKHNLYTKVPVEKCWQATGAAPIKTKWIDINKGDRNKPEYRSRWVAKEIVHEKRDDLFAATPPLEMIKMLLSIAVT